MDCKAKIKELRESTGMNRKELSIISAWKECVRFKKILIDLITNNMIKHGPGDRSYFIRIKKYKNKGSWKKYKKQV